jgi:hypothetical protein
MPGLLGIVIKATPWIAKQVPKMWPLLLDAKNRERVEQAVKDLASKSPTRRLRGQAELTASLAERMVERASSEEERSQASEWNRRAQNLVLRLDMPAVGRDAKRDHRQAVQTQLQQLQSEMDAHLGS